jgi:hypothetical protein
MATAPSQIDPFAAIRRLIATQAQIPQFDPNFQPQEQPYDPENPFGNIQLPPALQDAQGNNLFQDINFVDTNSSDFFTGDRQQFQSKFNQTGVGEDGTTFIRMQRPGGDKYDLIDAFYRTDPATGDMVMVGDPRQFREQSSNTSFLQGAGATLGPILAAAGAPMLANALGGGLLGGAAAGAVSGAGLPAISGGDSQAIGMGGLLGGVAGGVGGYFQGAGAPDAMGDYMRTGASEGSTIGNAYTGAGGQAGAVGANSIAAQMAIPSDFNPDSLFRNVADPTRALQPLGETFQMPGDMPPLSPLSQYVPSTIPTADPYAQTVEISGSKPFAPMPATGLEPLPAFDASSLGIADATAALAPLPAMASMPGAMPAAGAATGGLLERLLTNPRLIGAVAGGLLGGSGGGGSGGGSEAYTGPMPTITRGGWNPNPQASFMQVPQFGQGLLTGPGQANSGLWRFKG